MTSILDDLMRSLGPGMTENLAQRLETDPQSTRAAIEASIPVIVAALARNASSPEGESALDGALERDHDGSLLDDLSGFIAHPERVNGVGILRHVLGDRQPAIEKGISAKSGMDPQKIARIFQIVAPLVMAYLARQKQANAAPVDSASRGNGGTGGGLVDILMREMGGMKSREGGLGGIGGLLDQDGDGSSADDIAGMGFGMIRGMFR